MKQVARLYGRSTKGYGAGEGYIGRVVDLCEAPPAPARKCKGVRDGKECGTRLRASNPDDRCSLCVTLPPPLRGEVVAPKVNHGPGMCTNGCGRRTGVAGYRRCAVCKALAGGVDGLG